MRTTDVDMNDSGRTLSKNSRIAILKLVWWSISRKIIDTL